MMTSIKLIEIWKVPITSHNYHFVFVVRTFKMYSVSKFQVYSTVGFLKNIYLFLRGKEWASWRGAKKEEDRRSEAGPVLTAESSMWGFTWTTQVPQYRVLKKMFILRERERENESQAGSTLSMEPNVGLNHTNARSWPEPISRVGCLIDWATQVPLNKVLLTVVTMLYIRSPEFIHSA